MLRSRDKILHLGDRVAEDVFRTRSIPLIDDRAAGVISTFSGWGMAGAMFGPAATAAWPSANAAIFCPFRVPVPVVVDRIGVGTGATAGGNYDAGIYDADGTLMVSTGSTARPGAALESITNVTDTLLMPGLYYLALAVDGTSTMAGTTYVNAGQTKLYGMRQMASAFPLPNPATFATQTLVFMPRVAAYLKPEANRPWYGPMRFPPLNSISTLGIDSMGLPLASIQVTGNTIASIAGGQNLAYYVPFSLYEAATAVKMSVITGATQNGNVDVGIYDGNLNRLVNSGSTLQGAANTLQEFDITDTRLGPGLYYMAVQLSSATGTFFRAGAADELAQSAAAYYVQAVGSFGLPATATFSDSTNGTPAIPTMAVHFNTLV